MCSFALDPIDLRRFVGPIISISVRGSKRMLLEKKKEKESTAGTVMHRIYHHG
jgi:hypothetical protein